MVAGEKKRYPAWCRQTGWLIRDGRIRKMELLITLRGCNRDQFRRWLARAGGFVEYMPWDGDKDMPVIRYETALDMLHIAASDREARPP